MDTLTADTFEEARRQLFDPTVEEEDIRLAEGRVRLAEALRFQARQSHLDSASIKALDDRIKSQKQWIRTLKEIQGLKMRRQAGFRKIV